ncbi:hypothetical protein AGMMS4956_18460 [Bacteroidia bacterium]|nr:hypothetical protein AGMMS4956_18460 [Bacteroidia bacterium]
MSGQNPGNTTGTGAVLTYKAEEKVWEAKKYFYLSFKQCYPRRYEVIPNNDD